MWIKDVNESITWKNSSQYRSEFEGLKKLQGKARNTAVSNLFKNIIADFERFEKICEKPAVAGAIEQHLLNETLEDRVQELNRSLDEILNRLPKDC
jgi:hypothetical protein